MKVAFVGPILEQSGWGEASRNWLLALDSTGVDVAARPVLFGSPDHKPSERLTDLCHRPMAGADTVIQHLPPHLMTACDLVKSVGLFVTEGTHFRNSNWANHLNLQHLVLVSSGHNERACQESGVKTPVRRIAHATNTERYCRSVPPLELLAPLKEEGLFLFYTVGEWVSRKNYGAMLTAFHMEFDPGEPVGLVVKTSRPGTSPEELKNEVGQFWERIRAGCGVPKPSRPLLVVTERLTEVGVLSLHHGCDVFVQTSYGEAWSYPCFDAMALGKTPIYPEWGGYLEYLDESTGYPVGCRPAYGHGLDDAGWGTMGADVGVGSIDLAGLRRAMRRAYERKDEREEKARNGVVRGLVDFSHERVGEQIVAQICGEPAPT
jgi:glycosyltransferase involved in cell wall biosynthesis